MKSLEYLNGVASNTITFTDNRAANVLFDRPNPKDVSFTELGRTFSAYVATEIIEIIKPATTNIRVSINITNATVDFGTLPIGLTTTQVGTVYYVFGIDSISDWDAVKSPTITLDEDYFGDASYEFSIIYDTDTETDVTVSYNVGVFEPVSSLDVESALTVSGNQVFDANVEIINFFTLTVLGIETLGSQFFMNVVANATKPFDSNLNLSTSLSAIPKALLFDDATFNIDNPALQRDNHRFGSSLAIDSTGEFISSSLNNHDTYTGVVVNSLSGNSEFYFTRQGTDVGPEYGPSSILTFNNDYIVINESDDPEQSDDFISVWKKQSTGNLYTVIDTVEFTDPSGGSGGAGVSIVSGVSGITNNYLILADVLFDENLGTPGERNGKIYVYSIDDSTGLTLEYTHEGTTVSSRRQNLAGVAINDNYYVFSENYNINTVGSWHTIFVYDTATGTLQYTLNENNSKLIPYSRAIQNNELFVTYWDPDNSTGSLVNYDLSDGSENWNLTLEGATQFELTPIRFYDSNYIIINGSFYSLTTGNLESSPVSATAIVKDLNTMVDSDENYDDTYQNQGRIILRTENS